MTSSASNEIEKASNDNFRVLYICSAARCGSTLTDMFIGGHSQATSLGEINFLERAIGLNEECSCGEKLRNCPQWNKIFNNIRLSRNIDLIKNPNAFKLWDILAYNKIDQQQTQSYRMAVFLRKAWMMTRDHLPDVLRELTPIPPELNKALNNKMDLYRAIAQCWNKSVIVDSSKNFREAIELHRRWPDNIKVILLTRDGRGVYLSRRSSGHSQFDSVNIWLSYYRRALPLLSSHIASRSLLKIRYEDLASDPDATGRILCNFADIPFESGMLELKQATRHLVSGNKTRFASGKEIRLDTRWQTDLTGAELDFFTRAGGEMNNQLGYR